MDYREYIFSPEEVVNLSHDIKNMEAVVAKKLINEGFDFSTPEAVNNTTKTESFADMTITYRQPVSQEQDNV